MQLVFAAVAWSGDFGRPTLFNVAIACGLKLSSLDNDTPHVISYGCKKGKV
jgi:hypothetical protein